MALDYSKLSDAELQAIANDDYSKLSDATLTALSQEGSTSKQAPTPSDAVTNIAAQTAATGGAKLIPAATNFAARLPANIVDEALSLGRVAQNIGWEGVKDLGNQWMETPIKTTADIGKAWAQGHSTLGPVVAPLAGKTVPQAAGVIGKGALGLAGQALTSPENAFMLPYNMAAYEQEKIRANPTAPEYKNNPYAQVVRGEAPTQGTAGAMNAQKALINQQYGGLNPQEQAILQADRARQMAIQQKKQQARQVLAQQPTSQNFIERSKALAELYGGVGQ